MLTFSLPVPPISMLLGWSGPACPGIVEVFAMCYDGKNIGWPSLFLSEADYLHTTLQPAHASLSLSLSVLIVPNLFSSLLDYSTCVPLLVLLPCVFSLSFPFFSSTPIWESAMAISSIDVSLQVGKLSCVILVFMFFPNF